MPLRHVANGRSEPRHRGRPPSPLPVRSGLPLRSAQVAQLVEHVTENYGVGGSIPPLGTIFLQSPFSRATGRGRH